MEAGTRLGPYEIVSRIGAGGMGEVWRARDTRLGREVAIKMLPAEFAADAQLKIRFEREAKTISQLSHPNICTLFDVGENYLVMELLDGESLAQRIMRGSLPLSEVVRYGVQLAEGLAKAHREGIVHRDVKPVNVMLTKSGAKLLDFGLAKSVVARGIADGVTLQKPLTEKGVVLGTYQYMAPEQVAGAESDSRTDIFALGAVLYEMVTGRPAFQGSTRTSLIAAILGSDPAPVSDVVPVAPAALDHVIRKCLEKDPENRWQSAQDVAEELKWIGGGSGASAAGPPKPRHMATLLSAVVATVAIVAGAAVWLVLGRSGRDVPNVSLTIPSMTEQYSRASDSWISPDGKNVVFAAVDGSGIARLWIRALDKLQAVPLEGTQNGRWPFWSADGKSVLFIRGGKLVRVAVSGGPVQELASNPITENFGGACNAAGVVLFSTGSRGLQRIDPGGTASDFTKLDPAKFEIGHVFPTFLPDGKHFLFVALVRNPRFPDDTQHLYAGSLDSDARAFVGSVPTRVEYDRGGYLLTVRDGSLVAIPFDLRHLRMHGREIPIASPVSWFRPSGRAFFSVSANGTVIFEAWMKSSPLQWIAADGRVRRQFTERDLRNNGPIRASSDGHHLVVANLNHQAGEIDLWLWGLDTDTQTRLSFDRRVKQCPIFSADSRRIYYDSDVSGFPDIYERRIDSGEERFVVGGTGIQIAMDVSPDDRVLLYRTTEEAPGMALKTIALSDSNARPATFVLSPGRLSSGRFSPDGKRVAYVSNETGRYEAYVKPFPGPGGARQVTSGGAWLIRWSGDGKRIYFARNEREVFVADTERALSGDLTAQKFAEFPEDIAQFELLRDGSYLVQLDTGMYGPTNVITNWKRLLPR